MSAEIEVPRGWLTSMSTSPRRPYNASRDTSECPRLNILGHGKSGDTPHYSAVEDTREGPLAAYQRHRSLGQLKSGDVPQERVATALDRLFHDLSFIREPRGLRERLSGMLWKPTMKQNIPQGVYIYGTPGRGKTMLMDLFYATVKMAKKRRVHFHTFMYEHSDESHQRNAELNLERICNKSRHNLWFVSFLCEKNRDCTCWGDGLAVDGNLTGSLQLRLDIHSRLHKLLVEEPKGGAADSIKIVAEQLLEEAQLLCLDEVEVTDIADALILKQLFAVLWSIGMVVVATSNNAPEELYCNGLNRRLFEPFIKQLKEHCCVYSLDEEQSLDYRRSMSTLDQLYLYPWGDGNDDLMDRGFTSLTGWMSGSIVRIPVMMGRHIEILAANRVARASFLLLCGGPYGAADYLAIAQCFGALFLDRIPWLGDPFCEDEARRFITLIDVLYEANTVLVCSAAVSVDQLFEEQPDSVGCVMKVEQQPSEEAGIHVVGEGGSSGRSTTLIGEMEWSATGRAGASLAHLSGSHKFTHAASARTVSRLLEMQSRAYLLESGSIGEIILSGLNSLG